MKLITLNTWGGVLQDELAAWLASHARADIYCFQEVYHRAEPREYREGADFELYSTIARYLPDHEGHFHPQHRGDYGLAMFTRKNLPLVAVKDHFVHGRPGEMSQIGRQIGEHSRNIQVAAFKDDRREFAIINFHGLWNGQGKTDSHERIKQSENILRALDEVSGEIVLAGDYNLNPDTESLRLLEERGLRNLVKEYGITDTRTSHYKKPGRFADYILVSPGVKVMDFKVLPEEVSDHAALELEFEI